MLEIFYQNIVIQLVQDHVVDRLLEEKVRIFLSHFVIYEIFGFEMLYRLKQIKKLEMIETQRDCKMIIKNVSFYKCENGG